MLVRTAPAQRRPTLSALPRRRGVAVSAAPPWRRHVCEARATPPLVRARATDAAASRAATAAASAPPAAAAGGHPRADPRRSSASARSARRSGRRRAGPPRAHASTRRQPGRPAPGSAAPCRPPLHTRQCAPRVGSAGATATSESGYGGGAVAASAVTPWRRHTNSEIGEIASRSEPRRASRADQPQHGNTTASSSVEARSDERGEYSLELERARRSTFIGSIQKGGPHCANCCSTFSRKGGGGEAPFF